MESTRSNKLSSLVWEFNFRPDHYTHNSWLEQMPDGLLIKKLVGKQRSAERIVQHLLERFGLENQVFFNFSNSLTRIALWSGPELEKLVLYTGAVFFYARVQRTVVREELERVQEQLGTEIFSFMQRRASLMKGRMNFNLKLPSSLGAEKALIAAGLLCLHQALSEYPMALRKRLMLKLPYDWYLLYKATSPAVEGLAGQNKECAALIQKIAIEIRMGIGSDGQIRFN
ncbi:MAG: SctK family type III secretion system sorting platform protein [Thiolinea sp.]